MGVHRDEYVVDTNDGRTYYYDSFGNKIPVQDKSTHVQQRQSDSHLRFFKDNPKQKMRRADAVQERFKRMVLDRVEPGFHPDVKTVTDDEYLRMRQDPEFSPLSAYHRKLYLKNGRMVRPVLAGEVGMIKSTIYVLEPGSVPTISVGVDIGADDGE